jgi:hypothetical protein
VAQDIKTQTEGYDMTVCEQDPTDFAQLFREKKHFVGYQPSSDHFPDDMASFELFGALENAKAAYPDVPADQWIAYDFSDGKIPIEDPTFLD